jgi:hypothetical protein
MFSPKDSAEKNLPRPTIAPEVKLPLANVRTMVGASAHGVSAKAKLASRREPEKKFELEDAIEAKPIPIQWPSEQQILKVSKWLHSIKSLGMKCEGQGDYFNSGDLAYQLQEIIRSTVDLLHKCQRVNKRNV